jgi:hypothetical protein
MAFSISNWGKTVLLCLAVGWQSAQRNWVKESITVDDKSNASNSNSQLSGQSSFAEKITQAQQDAAANAVYVQKSLTPDSETRSSDR